MTGKARTSSESGKARTARSDRAEHALSTAMGWQNAISHLDGAQRFDILDALDLALRNLYVHLPLKLSFHGYDVLGALRKLKQDCTAMTNVEFHRELALAMARLRDAHTLYQGPWKQDGIVASLPFLVEAYGPTTSPSYVVSKVSEADVNDPYFRKGVVITHWNGVPFARAVEIYGDMETGGRIDSRRARAVETLTFRSLEYMPPPNEDWVVLDYLDEARKPRQVKLYWQGLEPDPSPLAKAKGLAARYAQSVNPAAEAVRRAKKFMFNPALWAGESRGTKKKASFANDLADAVTARAVKTKHGKFGYLRIWSFSVDDDERFLEEVSRLLEKMPDSGLIIDIRNNPGGYIIAAERLLQLFTPNHITPVNFALRSTALAAEMAQSDFNQDDLGTWAQSLLLAQQTGEPYSAHLPITSEEECNDTGQRYGGPVVLVADANTYSSGDLFAAGFVDNGLGPLVVIGQATGAGGANVWSMDDVAAALSQTSVTLPELPDGASFSMSIRRAVRSGRSNGSLIEDVGVVGETYEMTEDDVKFGNRDMLDHCASLLALQPRTSLKASYAHGTLSLVAQGLDVAAVHVDAMPGGLPVSLRTSEKTDIPLAARPGQIIDVTGYALGVVKQRRRLFI